VEVPEREKLNQARSESPPVQAKPNYSQPNIPPSRRFVKDVRKEDIILHKGNAEGVEALGYSLESCLNGEIQYPFLLVGAPGTEIKTLLSLATNKARRERIGGEYFDIDLLIDEFRAELARVKRENRGGWCQPDFGKAIDTARVVSFDNLEGLSIGKQRVIARKVDSVLGGGMGGHQQLFLGLTGTPEILPKYRKAIRGVDPDLEEKIGQLEIIPMGFPSREEVESILWQMFERADGILVPNGTEEIVHYISKIAPSNPSMGNLGGYFNAEGEFHQSLTGG